MEIRRASVGHHGEEEAAADEHELLLRWSHCQLLTEGIL